MPRMGGRSAFPSRAAALAISRTVPLCRRYMPIFPASSEAFASLTEGNIHARCFLYESAAESFSSVVSTMEEILFSGFDRRLAAFLLAETEREGGSEIRMTQSRIAECVNSAREVVTRMLKQFAQKGLVELKRGQVKLLDPD